MIRTVLFDLDDTLADSHAARVHALQRSFDECGVETTPLDFFRRMRGRELKLALAELAPAVADDIFAGYLRHYWEASARMVRLYAGVFAVLTSLSSQNVALGVVTHKESSIEIGGEIVGARWELDRLGVGGLISTVVGSDLVTNPKPHPESVLLALETLGADSAETIVVGDSPGDMLAAQAAGCLSCHATWGLTETHPPLDGIDPDYVAHAPDDVLRLVGV